ncbi:MAG: hypothetical protein K8J31_24120 [Anaerolineae bacterium]|nr:hypothetical protein [Anaerolineae bacterium]
MPELTSLLLEIGLLQFGRFASPDGWKPYRLSLEMLPSYPDVFGEVIEMAVPLVGRVDHLISTAPARAFGAGLSLRTAVPLVYSKGSDASPVDDLVGAYDIGHPALLLANDSSERPAIDRLIGQAHKVGLDVQRVLLIADEGLPLDSGIPAHALLDLRAVVSSLAQDGRLPAGQAGVFQAWLNRHRPG